MLSNGLAVIVAHTRDGDQKTNYAEDLAGLPQIAQLVQACKATTGINKVWVVTADPALAEPAGRAGADMVLIEPCDEAAPPDAMLLRTLQKHEAKRLAADLLLCVDAAFPLLRAQDYERLLVALHELPVDCVCAALSVPRSGFPSTAQSDSLVLTTSDLVAPTSGSWLVESGAACALRASTFRSTGKLRAGRIALQRFETQRSLPVSSALDRALAEVVLRQDAQANLAALLPKQLKAVVFDFDGVMTDNAVWVTQEGQESVRCDRGDGMGLGMLKASGVKLLILSKERNPVVTARAKKLGIECLQGIDNKLDEMQRWLAQHDVAARDTVYAGNDVNDLECMRHVGCAVCPQDAHASARMASRIVLLRDGGRGAVRELCDLILESLASATDFG